MDPNATLDQLEKCSSVAEARTLLRSNGASGFGKAYFARIASLVGQNPQAALHLTKFWSVVGKATNEHHYAFRAKAVGARIKGEWLASAQDFVNAGNYCEDPVERYSFQAGAVAGYGRAGKIDEAVRLGRRLARSLDKLQERGHAGRIRLNVASALCYADSYGLAKKWLQQALPDLESSGHAIEAAAARLMLSTAELYGEQPAAARRHAEEALAFYREGQMQYYADLCEINLAHDLLLRGRPDEGLRLLLKLRDTLKESPVDAARVEEYLGDAYLRLNLYDEALASYETAIGLHKGKQSYYDLAHCQYGKARALFHLESYSQAAAQFRKAADSYARIQNRVWQSAAELGEIACLRRLRSTAGLKARLDSVVESLQKAKSKYHLTTALLESAWLAIDEAADSEKALRCAYSIITRHGFPDREWEVHAIRAAASPQTAKLPHYRRAFKAMMASRLLTSSTVARARFLRDKSEVLSQYLSLLLLKPTSKRVAEAVDAIVQSRSAALVDEIIASGENTLSGDQKSRLETLRSELNAALTDPLPGGAERATRLATPETRVISKRWIELTAQTARQVANGPKLVAGSGAVIYSEAGGSVYRIEGSSARKLPRTSADMREALKWLEFEMLAPSVDPKARHEDVMEELQSLSLLLAPPPGTISPDGALWKVPWQALTHLAGVEEPVLVPSPAFEPELDSLLPKRPKVGIWYLTDPSLPHIGKEVEMLLELFPDADVCNKIEDIQERMNGTRYDVLHVASHASLNEANPMFSFLEFNGGKVYATDIARSSLRAKLVVLSACETGSVSFSFKEEPEGLARAFLSRSARAVIGTCWAVSDESALRFMEPFYSQLSKGKDIRTAMAQARARCQSWRNHPYFWAPFVIFGGYSA